MVEMEVLLVVHMEEVEEVEPEVLVVMVVVQLEVQVE
jgi:hypothetical protein